MGKECRWRTSTVELENNKHFQQLNSINNDDEQQFNKYYGTTLQKKYMRPAAHSNISSTTLRYHYPWIISLRPSCLCSALATQFYRFLARFSGRRRTSTAVDNSSSNYSSSNNSTKFQLVWIWFIILASSIVSVSEACSSRATPKPRPPAPTPRPNITFHTYACPQAYNDWYCLNGATCFSVIIGNSTLYNCECADGFMGPRCEFKDLDGSYLPSQHRIQLETASIAGGATIAIFLVFILCMAAYIRMQRRTKARLAANETLSTDCVDGAESLNIRPIVPKRVFGHNAAHPWREHLQRGVNTLALPMENIPTIVSETRQDCENSETNLRWMEQNLTTVPGGDRLSPIAVSPQQTRVV
ncbi:uncharacterized protein LOC123298518 [Chrysoperla carnea]|uniref:uncharacterized protein LOC123298518 n=1 Tax=Chrysoperla carnea TaxID=189513 RepID=UPI001D05D71B|nr:uncharacterized protein LOC123298518 [Chrysoperla carnea]